MTTDTYAPSAVGERIRQLCRQFRLPTLAAETVGRFSDAGHADALPTLVEVLEQEAEDRRIRRVDRLRRASKLPAGKTWDTFEHERAPVRLRQQLIRLAEGDFVDRDVNVLAFGLPGTGKTHAMCAIGHRLVQSGRSVLFIPAYRLVQDMLAAKRDLDLPRMLRKLDNFDLLVIDDLGYLPQGADESEVLFTLIAERYERRSLGITSNLVFSEWEKIFANPMATAAAIARCLNKNVTERELLPHLDVTEFGSLPHNDVTQIEEANRWLERSARRRGQKCSELFAIGTGRRRRRTKAGCSTSSSLSQDVTASMRSDSCARAKMPQFGQFQREGVSTMRRFVRR